MEAAARFVSYAFSIGDLFFELDEAHHILAMEGALPWIGLASSKDAVGRPIEDFVDPDDRALLDSSLAALENSPRLGAVRIRFGAKKESRRAGALFLSKLEPKSDRIFGVLVAATRLDGIERRDQPVLADPETFLKNLPDLLASQGEDSNVLVSLLELAGARDDGARANFARQLSALSLGGRSAAELGEGRYAVVHEADGPEAAAELMNRLRKATGMSFEAATLDLDEAADNETDAARALVYSIRKFADESPDFNLSDLSKNYGERMEETRKKIQMLRDLLKSKRYNIAYQPIVSIKTRKVHHVEALVRFDMRGGSPYELITFAEEVGIIAEFDTAMLDSAMTKLRKLIAHGAQPCIAVNLSARSLTTPPFVDALVEKLDSFPELAGRLMIEVTESAQASDISALGASLERIRSLGFEVCLDDFGAGVSGFQYLRNLKVDIVKIDGSYIRDAEKDAESRAFLHAMVTLCRDLRIRTVAEWVETEEQAKLMEKLGVDLGQGWLYGRPKLTLPKEFQPDMAQVG
ncbi:MAG: EAL domain-containing protein [Rhodothalassiaceae bacterium]